MVLFGFLKKLLMLVLVLSGWESIPEFFSDTVILLGKYIILFIVPWLLEILLSPWLAD